MSNTSSMTPLAQCPSCRGSGVAQYGYDDSGNPCGPVNPCSECEGTGEQTNWDEFVYGDTDPAPRDCACGSRPHFVFCAGEADDSCDEYRVHDTLPCPGPHECETLPPPAGEECA